MSEYVILVDEKDNEIGLKEKLAAHKDGNLHRAFSVFIFNSKNQLLMQKRAKSKYHSGGLWTNTCCSHPRKGEKIKDAVERRLIEELGFSSETKKIFDFQYKVNVGNGLIEHEYDHVFIGKLIKNKKINPDPEEVDSYRWMTLDEVTSEIQNQPENYTEWFKIMVEEYNIINTVKKHLQN